MVVLIVPADGFSAISDASSLARKIGTSIVAGLSSVPLSAVQQIVKTSGNLFASFLVQGGGLKFYQGEGQSSESFIIKAVLSGEWRFVWKARLETIRETKKVVFIFATSFGLSSGFVLNSFEVDQSQDQHEIFNCTLSLQKVQQDSFINKTKEALALLVFDMFQNYVSQNNVVIAGINVSSLFAFNSYNSIPSNFSKFFGSELVSTGMHLFKIASAVKTDVTKEFSQIGLTSQSATAAITNFGNSSIASGG